MKNITDDELTTISLKKRTRKRLENFGIKNETYDELVNRILDKKEGDRNDSNKGTAE